MDHTRLLSAVAEELAKAANVSETDLRDALNKLGLENAWGNSYSGGMKKVVEGAYNDLLQEAENIRTVFVNKDGKPYFESRIKEKS